MNLGILLLDFLLLIISFAAMHYISKRYFINSLDYLSNKLRLSSDMAGSTLMAAGSSAPELAVALFAILMAGNHEAIGVGAIVGSALFNILVIIGIVMYLRPKAKLVWQPIVRDIVFYIIAILLLGYTFHMGEITLWKGLVLVGTYVIYIIVIYFWKRIIPYEDIETEKEKKITEKSEQKHWFKLGYNIFDKLASRFQLLAFLVSIGLISLLSWLLVSSAVGISESLGVPELLIGITIVAVGTSVPDLISSMIVARQGRPGMAINNAIGSNTFDILVGLGVPFLIFSIIHDEGLNLMASKLSVSIMILMGSSVILLLFFIIGKWKSSKPFGIVLIILYLVYLGHVICSSSC
jgi:K+-dependent Na+/Ca+ exchanger-like protein